MKQRKVCWFSCGAASACATKLAVDEYRADPDPDYELVIARIRVAEEHADSDRFTRDCEAWFGLPIVELGNARLNCSVNETIRVHRYMSGPNGARCTKELKKQVRFDWQRFDGIHVFGMHLKEQHRIDDLLDTEPDLLIDAPLIRHGMSKSDCFAMVLAADIALPAMYRLGYHNNNCIGCLKASGAGYWNKIRKDFPEVFALRAEQERVLGVAMVELTISKFEKLWPGEFARMRADHAAGLVAWKTRKSGRGFRLRVPLRYLPSDAGDLKDLDIGACGFFCEVKS